MTLYVDGAFNKHTGSESWGFVTDEQGNDILALDGVEELLHDMKLQQQNTPKGKKVVIVAKFENVQQQNNGAELLSALAALRIANQDEEVKTIYSDSSTVVQSWSNGRYGKTIPPSKVKCIVELARQKATFCKRGGKFLFVSGDDNVADPGFAKHHSRKRQ